MPWQNQSGGGGGPWGRGPRGGGGGGNQPPNLEELLRRGQDQFRGMMPKGVNRPLWLLLGLMVIVAIWGLSGFYRVQPDEQGVVLRFGKWVRTTQPGLNYHIPYPIESVLTPKVTRENNIDIGFTTSGGGAQRDVPAESLMLTGDENIVDIDFSVVWVIKDAGKYEFNIRDPEQTVKAVAESAMREVIGKTPIQSALTEGRQDIEIQTKKLVQQALDEYEAGIEIRRLKLQKVDPPQEVIASFRDVQAARADQERLRNEAEAYENDILPRARGQAEKIIQGAEAYKEQVVNQAEGEGARFISIYNQYAKAKDVTRKRMYLETMEDILSGMNKVIIDKSASGSGVVPYLPLQALEQKRQSSVKSVTAADGSSSSQGGQP